ncbi:hypothetical protein CAPTEDRAFT_229297 [Capitella teleta]|uniref:Cep57 centrosome localisation domain-containing protein n=1 Tax=Capitella teleta TaxID=283909 RepID=R7VM03_CAPTE|nr:hypothetical protein CAPTEDRAFT_229297 [Capitella teleta]|eukprot:ELU18701.1 hypothetical protein CAPTEDRAFT_229297 [Capitella teleta]
MESSDNVVFGSPPIHRRFFKRGEYKTSETSDLHTALDKDLISNSQEKLHDGTGLNSTSYSPYPPSSQPTYDRYKEEIETPPSTDFTESHRKAVMSALRSLQDKIRKLELERVNAEDNLRSLASETTMYKDVLNKSTGTASADHSRVHFSENRYNYDDLSGLADTTHVTDAHHKLDSAEQRCLLLEKQLECMRRMVSSAEQERSQALKRSLLKEKQDNENDLIGVRGQLDKISELERDHLKLTATQSLAEGKIRSLEEKLREEQHYRRVMQEKAAQLETAAEANRIISQANGTGKPKKGKKKKKKTSVARPLPNYMTAGTVSRPSCGQRPLSADAQKIPGMEPIDHYKLNLAEMPFTAGKSTGPSHSLPANFQEVLSMMKLHNPQLCASPREHTRNVYNHFSPPCPGSARMIQQNKVRRETTARASAAELSDLLLQLQEEFSQLTMEHEELSKQITDCRNEGTREDLERELDHIVAKMQMKGDQIGGLRAYQTRSKKTKKKMASSGGTSSSGYGSSGCSLGGEVQVTTTVRTKGRAAGPLVIGSETTSKAQASLNLYKDLKKIQTTLRQDDVTWD